jgi:hypothetical protein
MSTETLEALFEQARRALLTDASEAARTKINERLESLAIELFLEWLTGQKRFESQSQQTEYWLSRFYDEIFLDEQPDATRIYERFRVHLSRAGYLARLLRGRRAAQWRVAAGAELKTELERFRTRAEDARREGQGHITEFDISLSPGAADELRVQYDRIATFLPERERPKPPKARPSFGNTRWLAIPADTLLLVLNNLNSANGK